MMSIEVYKKMEDDKTYWFNLLYIIHLRKISFTFCDQLNWSMIWSLLYGTSVGLVDSNLRGEVSSIFGTRVCISGLRWGVWSWRSVNCLWQICAQLLDFSSNQNQVVKPEMLKIEWWTRTFSPSNLGNFFRSKEIYIDRSLPCGKEDYFWAPCKDFW